MAWRPREILLVRTMTVVLSVGVTLSSSTAAAVGTTNSTRTTTQQLQALVAAALAHAGLEVEHPSWRQRLRWSALLPRLSGRAVRSDGSGEYLDLRSDRPAVVNTRDNYSLRYEVHAAWDLSRLVFDQRELLVERAASQRAASRQKLIERIVRLYYQRASLILEPLPQAPDQSRRQVLELARVTALLAALTGGASLQGAP